MLGIKKIHSKINYKHRYILVIVLYFLNDLISQNYQTADLGFIATFGGIILGPLMFLTFYLLGGVIMFTKSLSYASLGFKGWIAQWHKYNISIAKVFFDILLVGMFIMLFTGGWSN